MIQKIFELLAYFIIYSILGWILESIYRSICEKKIVNTGFLKGPFCPIYGIGAIIMILFFERFQNNIALLFIISMIVLTLWEYIVAIILEKTFNIKYWDYSKNKFNFQGRICLLNSIYWGILGVIFTCFIQPFVRNYVEMIPNTILEISVGIIILIVMIDAINTIVKVKSLKSTLEKIEQLNTQIKEKLQELKEIKIEEKNIQINLQKIIDNLDKKRKNISHRLYKRVYRLKKAFPAIDSKEITEILNRKIEFKKIKNIKERNKKKEAKTKNQK